MKLELAQLGACHPGAPRGSEPVIRQMNLKVDKGEQLALIGPSGAGKTTLLQVMACTLPPRHGHLAVDGENPWLLSKRSLHQLRSRLILAPQVPPLPPRQRVVTSVLAGRLPSMGLLGGLRSLFYPADIPAVHQALLKLDLPEKIFERADRLSGGERQRVGLARLFVSPASLWLVDEPLSALDPTRARQAMSALTDTARESGNTLVCTLHQVDMALAFFPRIVGLRDGQIAFDLPAAEVSPDLLKSLYDQHEHELSGQNRSDVIEHQYDHAPQVTVVNHCR